MECVNIFLFKMRQIALITIWYRKIIYIIILLPLYQRRWSISHWQYFCEICRNYLKTKCNVKMHMIIIQIGWMSVLLHFISLSNNMSRCLSWLSDCKSNCLLWFWAEIVLPIWLSVWLTLWMAYIMNICFSYHITFCLTCLHCVICLSHCLIG